MVVINEHHVVLIDNYVNRTSRIRLVIRHTVKSLYCPWDNGVWNLDVVIHVLIAITVLVC